MSLYRVQLFERWGTGTDGFGGCSTNQAWSGGGLTILAQYVCGLYPLEPAWKKFMIKPDLGGLEFVEMSNETIAGKILVKITKNNTGRNIELLVPEKSEAIVYIPQKAKSVIINGKEVKSTIIKDSHKLFILKGGEYKIWSK